MTMALMCTNRSLRHVCSQVKVSHFTFLDVSSRSSPNSLFCMTKCDPTISLHGASRRQVVKSRSMSFSHVRQFSSSIANFDHYRILGVRRNASSKEIKAAFYHLSLIFHPDMQPKKTKMNRANSYNAAIRCSACCIRRAERAF